MASINFPTAFLQPLYQSFDEEMAENWIEEETYAGIQVRRRVLTETFDAYSYDVMCTAANRLVMREFVKITTNGGILAFNWTHPEDGTIYECKFKSLPKFRESGAFNKPWLCSITVEVISSI